jgi:hypothetical protein
LANQFQSHRSVIKNENGRILEYKIESFAATDIGKIYGWNLRRMVASNFPAVSKKFELFEIALKFI